MKLDFAIVKEVVKLGLPMFLVQAATSVYTIVVNNSLGSYGGDLNIAAFSVINGYVVYMQSPWSAPRHLWPAARCQLQLRRRQLQAVAQAAGLLHAHHLRCAGRVLRRVRPVLRPRVHLFCGGDAELAALPPAAPASCSWAAPSA